MLHQTIIIKIMKAIKKFLSETKYQHAFAFFAAMYFLISIILKY